jgi:hypothetical protein
MPSKTPSIAPSRTKHILVPASGSNNVAPGGPLIVCADKDDREMDKIEESLGKTIPELTQKKKPPKTEGGFS